MPRTSRINAVSFESLLGATKSASTFVALLSSLGLPAGGNIQKIKRRLDAEGIDYSHLATGQSSNRGRRFGPSPRQIPLEQVLVDGRPSHRGRLKSRLIEAGLLTNECGQCRNTGLWNGQPLVLQLDHKNGKKNDNRIENLRLLCPNCHSQTETFAGRNIGS